jgi:hypothetical protein
MALTRITSDGITDAAIVNADINASAAIAGTKISPNFGTQAVTTTGALSSFAATISGDNQDSLNFTGTSTNANRGIAFNSKTALSHSNDSALRINNNAEFSSVNIFAVDNATSAFTLNQGSNEYITVDTNNSSELITLGNTTTNPKTVILGGNVGIGTSSPQHDLDILKTGSGDDTSFRVGSTATSGDNDATIVINNGGSGDASLRFDYESSASRCKIYTNSSTNDLIFDTDGNETMRLKADHKVGIGTTSPAHKLDLDNGSVRFNRGNSAGEILLLRGLNANQFRFDTDGLKFGSDTAAANAISDYEEGTWTPSITMSNGDQSIGYEFRYGTYTKIGRKVYVEAYVKLNAISNNGTGYMKLVGLPFNSINSSTYGGMHCPYYNSLNNQAMRGALVERNDNFAFVYYDFEDSSAGGTIQNASIAALFGTNSQFVLVGSYQTP